MLIFDSHNDPIILDDADDPILTDTYWVLDLQMMDYTLAPLLMVEEIVDETVELNINGFKFILPAMWHILVVDIETQQIDVARLKKIAAKDFNAFVFGPKKSRHESIPISFSNFYSYKHNYGPSLFKHQMLCHPIDNESWINIAPSDSYNKYLKNKVSGDIV